MSIALKRSMLVLLLVAFALAGVVAFALAREGGVAQAAHPGDNGQIAFTRFQGNFDEIFRTNADGTGQTNLNNTPAGDEGSAWSPDGRFVAFRAGGELRKLSLADGTVQTICALPSGGFGPGDWNEEGTIVFSASSDGVRETSSAWRTDAVVP